ncbi:MAG: hypothetical protein K2Q26_02740 [Bdellovibrionales bacterium]|nr:hypothetical protein [Bdellovibrionales bacterium]
MRATLLIIAVFASVTVTAKESKKKYLGPIESPPGGARADHDLWKQWEGMVKHQHFPPLPHSSKLEKNDDKLGPQVTRKRYIMQIATDMVDLKNEIYDEGYYYFAYTDKEQGNLMLVVHPKYRKCFDDLRKKFDFMQAVVYQGGALVGRIQVVLEYPRQCLGQLKDTGSKLRDAN